ncbi:hypothetical protein BGW38_001990 [Lunasporangiospora selenospora]|uniref:Uncharacterized protein n=1 Tax=Lunasporangiospora selenospora TaxID=979761 RepID=A0A9P6KDW6_9FUNG|nr:hypothetical protein BGW38_001990 [Lunasporangiospora selenospora]
MDVKRAWKALKLERSLLRIGDKNELQIYVDGNPAIEKLVTHNNRGHVRRKVLVEGLSCHLDSRLAAGFRAIEIRQEQVLLPKPRLDP